MITRQTTFYEALNQNARAQEIFMEFGLHCIGCMVAAEETIEDGAKAHGFSEEEINILIDRLNDK